MTRQHTLAKFFTMPPGKKAPPQQSSLTELWGAKRKKQSAPAAPTTTSDGHLKSEPAATNDTAPPEPATPKRKPATVASPDGSQPARYYAC
ncbi:hypothetical protein BC826DRAFT_1005734, partial [Russula brevipes]